MARPPLYSKLRSGPEDEEQASTGPRRAVADRRTLLIAALVLCNLASLALLCFRSGAADCVRPRLITTPALEAIRYERKTLWRSIVNNSFTGEPRPELDAAWARLLEPITVKISAAELAAHGGDSIAFRDGSGFLAEPAVYHELHCIKRIRQHLHPAYYHPSGLSPLEQRLEGPHIDHCLEYLREAAMCRGDTALALFRWGKGKPYSTVESTHECVDWDRLDGWARGRAVDLRDLGVLVAEEEHV
ncbi:hypothetical protein CDD83_3257 [Cordyceps sp. RAO-2017]|nr:hypothetical protein CDD83_3257 [Cordyceps sp. RAO-2017]